MRKNCIIFYEFLWFPYIKRVIHSVRGCVACMSLACILHGLTWALHARPNWFDPTLTKISLMTFPPFGRKTSIGSECWMSLNVTEFEILFKISKNTKTWFMFERDNAWWQYYATVENQHVFAELWLWNFTNKFTFHLISINVITPMPITITECVLITTYQIWCRMLLSVCNCNWRLKYYILKDYN